MPVAEVEEMDVPGPTRAQSGMEVWAHIAEKSPKGMVGGRSIYWEEGYRGDAPGGAWMVRRGCDQ